MNVLLRPLRDDEFDAWRERSQTAYGTDLAANGGLDEERAAAKAETDYSALLPDRLETAGHTVYAVERDGQGVGSLWLAERPTELGPGLFVYELYVDADQRGGGVGRAAMLLAEEEATRRGIGSITLNVMGGNEPARGLYRGLGYREVAVFMEKQL